MADSIGGLAVPVTVDVQRMEAGVARAGALVDQMANNMASKVAGIAGAFAPAAAGLQSFTGAFAGGNLIASLGAVHSATNGVIGQLPGISAISAAWNAMTGPVGLVSASLTAVYYAGTKALSAIEKGVFQLARAWGTSAEKAQEFEYALATFGKTTEDVSGVFDKMRAKVGDLKAGEEGATRGFARIGIAASDLQGLGVPETFRLISERLSAQTDASLRASMAMDIFGKQWASIEGLMFRGGAQFAAATEQAHRFGLVLSTDQVAKIKKIVDETKRVGAAWGSVATFARNQLALMMAPVVEAVSPVLMKIREAVQPVLDIIGGVMQGMGASLGVAAKIIAATVKPIISGIGWVLDKIASIGAAIGKALAPLMKGFDLIASVAESLLGQIGRRISQLVTAATTTAPVPETAGGVATFIAVGPGTMEAKIKALLSASSDAIAKVDEKQKTISMLIAAGPKVQGLATAVVTLSQYPQVLDAIIPGLQGVAVDAGHAAAGLNLMGTAAAAMAGAVGLGPSIAQQNALNAAIFDSVEGLIDQAQTFGMSARQIERFRLVQQGATDDTLSMFDEISAALDGYQLDADVRKQSDALTEQIATFGMSAEQIAIWRLRERGADDAALGMTETLQAQLRAMREHQKELEDWVADLEAFEDAANAIAESVKSPVEKFDAEFDRLSEMFARGALDADQYALALSRAFDELDRGANAKLPASPTAAVQGSSAAFSAILAATREPDRRKDPAERVAEAMERSRLLQERQVVLARETRDALVNLKTVPAAGV